VKFPNTAYPPRAITDLHKKHFNLYVEYAGPDRDSVLALSGTESYKMDTVTTPLLTFLKVTLPLGGIPPGEVRKALEYERERSQPPSATTDDTKKGSESNVSFSHRFALELAYVIEMYGDNTEEEAKQVVDLYSRGAESLTLAVSFAQRAQAHSSTLWDILIEHCLATPSRNQQQQQQQNQRTNNESGDDEEKQEQKTRTQQPKEEVDGSLFGSLLEAAALSGADLAHLVTKIPHGMAIEGLRPRLVAAVADYRHKLRMYEFLSEIATTEKTSLLREVSHRSRRGAEYNPRAPWQKVRKRTFRYEAEESKKESDRSGNIYGSADRDMKKQVLPRTLRTVQREDRHSMAFTIPIR